MFKTNKLLKHFSFKTKPTDDKVFFTVYFVNILSFCVNLSFKVVVANIK